MKKVKRVKMFLCMAMAVALLGHTTTTVWAAVNHVEGCNNTVYTYNQCAEFVSYAVRGSHSMVADDGSTVTCIKNAEMHFHDVLCANASCRALYESNKVLPCIIRHNQCGTIETQVCKTMN